MEQISKTVRDRLAAQQTASDHPDADLLTAYAENTLQAGERDTVMTHLARCNACRDLALLAAPEVPAVVSAPRVATPAPRRRWFARPALGWLSAGAAVVVVGAAVTLNQSRTAHETPAVAVPQIAAPTETARTPDSRTVPPSNRNEAMSQQVAQAPKQQLTLQARSKKAAPPASKSVAVDQFASVAENSPTPSVLAFGEPSRTEAIRHVPSSRMTQNAASISGPHARESDLTASLHPPAAPPLHDAPIKAAQSNSVILSQSPASSSGLVANTDATAPAAPSSAPANETATGAAPPLQASATPAANSSAGIAGRRPAIAAGTAMSTMKTSAGSAIVAPDASGVAGTTCSQIPDGLRCSNGTRTSELREPGANLHTFATMADTVWVGGNALFRSSDGGFTWTKVSKPSDDSVSQIVIRPDAVYVRTVAGVMWKTTDNGATWMQSAATK